MTLAWWRGCYCVYAILREDGTPFYIGATRDLPKRQYQHKTGCGNQHDKNAIIDAMLSAGAEPEFKIIKDRLSEIEAAAFERGAIQKIRAGLTNVLPKIGTETPGQLQKCLVSLEKKGTIDTALDAAGIKFKK